jgi:hypothetical protein
MRLVQQLVYDGRGLFCPDHPDRDLEDEKTTGGKFSVICTAPIGNNLSCMNSAAWPDRNAMLRDFRENSG